MALTINPNRFVIKEPRRLPVLLLLDTSTSMDNQLGPHSSRIDVLNQAVEEMLKEFSAFCSKDLVITVGAIAYNSEVEMLKLNGETYFSPANHAHWKVLQTAGCTCMGAALQIAKAAIEDKALIRGKDYRPLVILLTDGEPNDDWEGAMEAFCKEGRSAVCDRLAIMLGDDANRGPLERFVSGTGNHVLHANDAQQLSRFFKLVTMSVGTRTLSKDPNQSPVLSQEEAQTYIDTGAVPPALFAPSSDADDEPIW